MCHPRFTSLAVVFFPSLRQISSTVDALINALSTPSEAVQRACATCLPGRVKHMQDSAGPLLARLQNDLINGADFAVRRGAVYGIAGCIKGFGIAVLKSLDVMTVLEEAAQAKSPEARQVPTRVVVSDNSSPSGTVVWLRRRMCGTGVFRVRE